MATLAFLGTASDVGKSVLVTAFCRAWSDAGLDVAPYKAQNMSNNAGVTPGGGEMGRAQIVQAQAARVAPHTDMNPVLIKPSSDRGAQVVLHGRVLGERSAAEWFADTTTARREAYAALDRLRARHAHVILEGAGSCAEVNLRARDYVNFDAAGAAGAPVVLVADIHRGGVFAQVVGTLACLEQRDRARVAGVLVNRFRGDPALFRDGVGWLERETRLPVFGVVPWLRGLDIEAEDGLPMEVPVDPPPMVRGDRVRVGVVRLPRIANHTDFAGLARHPGVALAFASRPRDDLDLLILPGTKNTRADLQWLEESGWAERIRAWNGPLVGICGGYQMLGRTIADPDGVEGSPGVSRGLGRLPVETVMTGEKRLCHAEGRLFGRLAARGYELHVGETRVDPDAEPALMVDRRTPAGGEGVDGARVGRVWGCYLHGVLDGPAVLDAVLREARPDLEELGSVPDPEAAREAAFDRLAAHVDAHVDRARLAEATGSPG